MQITFIIWQYKQEWFICSVEQRDWYNRMCKLYDCIFWYVTGVTVRGELDRLNDNMFIEENRVGFV